MASIHHSYDLWSKDTPRYQLRSNANRAKKIAAIVLASASVIALIIAAATNTGEQRLSVPKITPRRLPKHHQSNLMSLPGHRGLMMQQHKPLHHSGSVQVNVMVPKETPQRKEGVPSLSSANFTLKQMIGQMRPSGDNPNAKVHGQANNSVVNFFSATGRSNDLGKTEEVPLLLKEYRGDAKNLAMRELAVQARIRVGNEDARALPVLPILGTFESKCIVHMTENGFSFGDKSLWTVESLNGITDTLVSYPYYPQKQQFTDKLPIIGPEMFLRRRESYIRKVVKGMLESLANIHDNGIAHGALDMTSILVTTFDETKTKDIKVRLSNFGYAINTAEEVTPDIAAANKVGIVTPASLLIDPIVAMENSGKGEMEHADAIKAAKRDDVYRMGLIFAELVYGAMSPEGPNARTHSSFIERRLRFKNFDVDGLREWSLEPTWTLIVDFLDKDEKAGWDLLQLLIQPKEEGLDSEGITAQALNHRFFKDTP